ncbi:MAG: TolC family protein [Rhizobiales bacterium]|nr:TolC family protein [Hyphomicrobiales bacterium]
MMRTVSMSRIIAAVGGTLLLSACKTFSPDGGMSVPAGIAADELRKDVIAVRTEQDAAVARAKVDHLLKRPLTADAAVQIALLNNRGLQAAYNELALAEARMVEGSLPPNPNFLLSRTSTPAELDIERQIVVNILLLATLPVRTEIAADRFRQAQLRAAEETLRVAAETRRNYYRAVAGRELVGFLTQAQSAANMATEFAVRLGETGAMNKLDQAREQVFYAELTGQLAAARQRATSDREALVRSLGLWGADLQFKLPSALPALPPGAKMLPGVEREAIRKRVDLQVARIELDALAKSYGLTQATRFINLLDVAGVSHTHREAEGSKVSGSGVAVEFQVPIFDGGEVRVRQAESTYMEAVNRLAERAVNVRSEARNAYRVYRSAYDIASHYRREVLPLRKIISDETLLRYNAMQIDVFSLLAEARQRIAAITAAIEAQRDFWLATTDLSVAVAGGGVSGGRSEGPKAEASPAGGVGAN